MRTYLVFITLNGINFLMWTLTGCCRVLDNRLTGLSNATKTFAFAQLAAASIGVFSSGLSVELVLQAGYAITGTTTPAAGTAWAIGAAAYLWVAACGAAGLYVGARLFAVPLSKAAVAVFAVPYALFMVHVARSYLAPQTTLARYEAALPAALGLMLLAGWLGLALAGRRVHQAEAACTDQEPREPTPITRDEVAILIAAHNEETSIYLCLDSVLKVTDGRNVFVASDGSSDNTVALVRERGCNVLDIQPNGGKAKALQAALDEFQICARYKAVLILDADSSIDEHYLERALPLFDDAGVAAVAGHAIIDWPAHWRPRWSMFFVAYRVRLYKVLQACLRFGQTWKYTNVSFIVPGFASMYRSSVLPHIDITAPGLVIEDYNMTFEIHHKKLGRIDYSPRVRAVPQEVQSLRDYLKQVRRWYLGFWQTVRRHGWWPGFFWLSLGAFIVEMLLQGVTFMALPVWSAWALLAPNYSVELWLPLLGTVSLSLADVAVGVLLADYLLTVLVSLLEKKPILLVYGLGFMLLRWADAFLFLYALPLAFIEKSDGRWVSPHRA